MSRNSSKTKQLSQPSVPRRVGQALRRYLVVGLATVFPVVVTILIVWQIFLFADGFLGKLVNRFLGYPVPGLGLILTVLIILAVGVLSVHFFGRILFQAFEYLLSRLPLFNKVYGVVKQFAEFLFEGPDRQGKVRGVVLIEYPRKGLYTMGFVTNETETSATGSARTMLTILLPNPPSPFTGPIFFVPKEDVIPLSVSVEDAVKFILSFGVVALPLRVDRQKLAAKE